MRRGHELICYEIIFQAKGLYDIVLAELIIYRHSRGIELAHLIADYGKHLRGLVILIGKQLTQQAHRGVVLAPRQRLCHVKNYGLGNMMGDRVHIRFRDPVALSVACDLIYFGYEPVHQAAADGYEPLGGVELNALAGRGKTLYYPFYKLISRLGGHADLRSVFCEAFVNLQPLIRLKGRAAHEHYRAAFRDITQYAYYLVRFL